MVIYPKKVNFIFKSKEETKSVMIKDKQTLKLLHTGPIDCQFALIALHMVLWR